MSAAAGPLAVAVVGAGWAGLAAAVEAASAGARVTLFEMAPAPGGRARDVVSHGRRLDNGQHICIGAYTETLRLLRAVGIAEADAFLRLPLTLVEPSGDGLRLGAGPTRVAFAVALARRRGWSWRERWAALRWAARWGRRGRRGRRSAEPDTVDDLARGLPVRVRRELIEPLCIAALNTPSDRASATVFLRVLADTLGAGAGAADLLLPRLGLGSVFPWPAIAWLRDRGVDVRLGARVAAIAPTDTGWQVDEEAFDRVVVAASAVEASRLIGPIRDGWAGTAAALPHAAIATVYLQSDGAKLPLPMLALPSDDAAPAQFVFDRGRLDGAGGMLAFVVSGADPWLGDGTDALERAIVEQARRQLAAFLAGPPVVVRTLVEKRATFVCTPGIERPPQHIARGLAAAGDYVEGPYPSTLEGAVRSGVAAARSLLV